MAEPTQFVYKFRELAELLVREQGLTHGHWGILVRFGLQATNVPTSPSEMIPAAVVPIMELGIQRFEEANALTVDAAEIAKNKKK